MAIQTGTLPKAPTFTKALTQSASSSQQSPAPSAPVPNESFVPSPIDQKEFRGVLSQFATGVAVITTAGDDGEKAGMTVSSFTSLSLDPPLILFCAKEGSKSLAEVQENGHFAVSVLADDQKDLCYQFAGKSEGDKFNNVKSRPGSANGDPLLDGSLATLECKLSTMYPGGDHTIVIGEVLRMEQSPPGDQPLLFWDGKVQQ